MTPNGCHPLSKVDDNTSILVMQANNITDNFQPQKCGWLETTREKKQINIIKKTVIRQSLLLTGNFLSSQAVSSQVLSAFMCLTTVFGMGTGGTT